MLSTRLAPTEPFQDSLLTATGAHFLRDPGSLPRLRDRVATFLFAGRASSEFQYPSQRHTRTHKCRTMARPATPAVTDKVLPSTVPAHRTHRNKSTDTQNPLLLGWQGLDFTDTGAHIKRSGHTGTRTFVAPLSIYTAPLSDNPAWIPASLLMGLLLTYWCTLLLCTHPTGTPQSWITWILHPPHTSGPTWGSSACFFI